MEPSEELVRLKLVELRRLCSSQTELIVELSRAGFRTGRIAELLNTTPNTVNVTLQKSKQKQRNVTRRTNASAENPEDNK